MTPLTEHFAQEELGVLGTDERMIENAKTLCEQLLEPIHAHYGHPVRSHCGYRNPQHNAAVGGKPNSYHLYEEGHAAVDIDVIGITLADLFEWLCSASKLPFDEVILERNSAGIAACVHLQIDRFNKPRRLGFTGSTGAGTHYTPVTIR
jgi:hypothetical protein